jgi:hypothetical protein
MGFHWPRLSLDHADEDEAVARRFAELREQYEEVCLGLPWDTKGLVNVAWCWLVKDPIFHSLPTSSNMIPWIENGWKMDGKWMEHAKMCKDSQEHLIRNDGSDAGRRIHPFCCAHSYHTLYIVYCPLPVDIKLSSVPGCLIAIRRSCLSRSLSFDRMQFWAFSWAVSIALNQTLQDVLVQSLQLSPFAHVAKTNIRTASSTRNRTKQQRSQSTSFDQIYAAMKGNAWGKAGDQNWSTESTAIIYYVKTCEKWKGIVLCGAVSTFITKASVS